MKDALAGLAEIPDLPPRYYIATIRPTVLVLTGSRRYRLPDLALAMDGRTMV